MNSHTARCGDAQITLDVLERRAVFGREVVPNLVVAAVHRVLDLVDLRVAPIARHLDCHQISLTTHAEMCSCNYLLDVPQPSKYVGYLEVYVLPGPM